MDMPAMKRNAGKTKSTNVIPLRPWKWRNQSGTTLCDTLAISLTKIMLNMTNPRAASMEVTRAGRWPAAVLIMGSHTTETSARCLFRLGRELPGG